MNYLIFRTDRVGDLLVSSILMKSIKRSNINNKIFVVCSAANYDLAKNLSFIDDVFMFKKGFFNKLRLLIKINLLKIENILILDGKDRSILFSMFLFVKKKIYVLDKKKFSFILNSKKNNLLYDDEVNDSKINIIKKVLGKLSLFFDEKDIDIFENEYFYKNSKESKTNFLNKKNFYLLHYDEKWIKDTYISTYKNIELNYENFNNFLFSIIKKSEMDLVVTSGKETTKTLDLLKVDMNLLSDNIYIKKINNNYLYFVEKPNFNSLIDIIHQAKLCITCHGSPTHISSSFNIKTIDIVDYSKISQYRSYTKHLQKYNEVIRVDPEETTKKILNLL